MSKYSREFKLEVVKRYALGRYGFRATGSKFAIDDSLVRRWIDVHKCLGPDGFGPRYERRTAEFKLNVLKQIQTRGLSLREARRELKIGTESSNWCGKDDMLKVV
jgi:transposase-like protein